MVIVRTAARRWPVPAVPVPAASLSLPNTSATALPGEGRVVSTSDEGAQAQRGQAACPTSHREEGADLNQTQR